MQPDTTAAPAGLANIKRVVVMMFENRSFDHVMGALPGVNGLFENGAINQDYYNLADPLQAPSTTNLPVYPAPIDPSLPQASDFTHDFGDGMMPDLFGPTFTVTPAGAGPSNPDAEYSSGFVNGAPTGQTSPTQTWPATNSGFYTTFNTNQPQGQAALTYFEDGALQVLHSLAKAFVLCDNWYCDMPGHTLPNRSFIHCASTGSAGIDDSDGIPNTTSRTIFQVIDLLPSLAEPSGWKLYAPVADLGGGDIALGQLDTRFLNSHVSGYQGAPITEFATDCQNGTLPFYSFIMCWLPPGQFDAWTDTSMHPNALIQPGENLLAAVYNALCGSPCWQDTLLVVTFDENGGIYDHVFPPAATPPDPNAKAATQNTKGSCRNDWKLDSEFDFSLLGLRVPALLISPWLAAGIDSTQYQNTSVVRFLIDTMNARYGTKFGPLTQRDATAASLEAAFNQFGQSTMRQDCPSWIAPYATLPSSDPYTGSDAIPYNEGELTVWTAPPLLLQAPPVAYVQELLNIYLGPLPGHPDSGQAITRDFATNAEVADYMAQRLQAAGQTRQAEPATA